jgi:hypothetical protein
MAGRPGWSPRSGQVRVADLTHLTARVPDGQGNPAETERRHEADVSAIRHEVAARVYVAALADGDEGAAAQHLASLQHDPGIDPWRFCAAVAARALRSRAGGSPRR